MSYQCGLFVFLMFKSFVLSWLRIWQTLVCTNYTLHETILVYKKLCSSKILVLVLLHFQSDLNCFLIFPPLRGTAAIGPIIAALKDGKSIVHEGKEVKTQFSFRSGCSSKLDLLTFLSLLVFRSDPSRSALLLIQDQSLLWSSVRLKNFLELFAPISSLEGNSLAASHICFSSAILIIILIKSCCSQIKQMMKVIKNVLGFNI